MIVRSTVRLLSRSLRATISCATIVVVARLRLVGVGDGRHADLEVALRLRELLGHRGLLRLGELDVVLRRAARRSTRRDAQDQILLGHGEREVGLLDVRFA